MRRILNSQVNLLIVGGDTKGAWQMRAVQLGRAMGACVTSEPTAHDWAWADFVVLVKRAAIKWKHEVSQLRVRVAWDVLDFWEQPDDNQQAIHTMVQRVHDIQHEAGIRALVGATRDMANDLGGIYVTHHCRIGLTPTEPRKHAEVVGYDGTKKYLGRWGKALERSCAELGLRFVVNPPDLSTVDVLVSFRDGQWDGPLCRRWKSGVKYVNAIVAGRPVITQPCSARFELLPIGPVIDDMAHLTDALREACSDVVRADAYEMGKNVHKGFQVETVADYYADLLGRVRLAA